LWGTISSQSTTPNVLHSNCHSPLASSSIDDTVPVVIIFCHQNEQVLSHWVETCGIDVEAAVS
jgi:hypothetical protein